MNEIEFRRRFADNLREARMARQMTQKELADVAAVHPSYIGQLECGSRLPSIFNAVRLAEALEVEVGELCSTTTK